MATSALPQRLGRYEILGELARGGMAELYLARLPGVEGFSKHVVIKRVLPELARDREFVDMFVAEARIAATLDHQNIVHVHDIGQDDAGYFFAMELLHGADVGTILSTVTRFGGELPIAIAIEIARAACAGLHYAHERRTLAGEPLGLVHRDISPQNLFVTFDGAVKVLDFGIAKAVQTMPASRTRSGALRGKVPYMSPEQCNAEPLDRRSDVFSLAVVLWEMTVGERLYGGNDESELATLKAIVERDAPAPSTKKPGYPPELERVVMKGLARDRHARYETADAFQVELEALARTKGFWTSAREMAAFMATAFPDRAQAWKDSERRGTMPIITSPRLTTPLPTAPPTSDGRLPLGTGTTPHTRTLAPEAASPPAPVAMSPAPARRSAALVAVAVAIAALAGVIGFVFGRSGHDTSPATKPPTAARISATEDAQWFLSDDYLISDAGYHGERLDFLYIAKMVEPAARAGAGTKFLDANGHERTTEHYWKSRIASPGELSIGTFAFCQAPGYLRVAKKPKDRAESRREPWMMGRVTDVAKLEMGQVTVADVVCDVDGVRVPVE